MLRGHVCASLVALAVLACGSPAGEEAEVDAKVTDAGKKKDGPGGAFDFGSKDLASQDLFDVDVPAPKDTGVDAAVKDAGPDVQIDAAIGGDSASGDPPFKAVPVSSLLSAAQPQIKGTGCAASCQMEITIVEGAQVIAGSDVHLQSIVDCGTGPVTSYAWTASGPGKGCPDIIPGPFSPAPNVRLDVVGHYQFCLQAIALGSPDVCGKICVSTNAVPPQGLHAELTWSTTADFDECNTGVGAGADLDLHALAMKPSEHVVAPCPSAPGPWGTGQPECSWLLPEPEWPPAGPEGDPLLVRDDTDGAGPEVLTLATPQVGTDYFFAVHYADDAGFGCSTANLRLFAGGEKGQMVANVSQALAAGEFWAAARLSWLGPVATKPPAVIGCGAKGEPCSKGEWFSGTAPCVVPCAEIPGVQPTPFCEPAAPLGACP